MSEYEIKCSQTWAWYPGYVHDFSLEKKEFYVTYPNDWKEPSWEKAANIRRAPPRTPVDWIPRLGDSLDCQARSEEDEPFGWWPCTVRAIEAPNRYLVSFDGWEDQHNENLSKEFLRPRNGSPPLSDRNMSRDALKVPPELIDWVKAEPPQLSELRKQQPRLIHMNFNHDTNEMVLVAPTKILRITSQILSLHFKRRMDLIRLKSEAEQMEEKVQQLRKEEENASRREFRIHPFLIGYLYGRDGSNVRELRARDPKLLTIDTKDNICTITGRTEQSVQFAREWLEIVVRKVLLTSDEIQFIIGREGQGIRELRDHVDVHRIISKIKFPEEFERMKERMRDRERIRILQRENRMRPPAERRRRRPQDIEVQLAPELENATVEEFFGPEDVINLSNDPNPQDALIIIGRKTSAQTAVTMMQMVLMSYQRIQDQRTRNDGLWKQLCDVKGLPPRPRSPRRDTRGPRGPRGRGRGRGGRGRGDPRRRGPRNNDEDGPQGRGQGRGQPQDDRPNGRGRGNKGQQRRGGKDSPQRERGRGRGGPSQQNGGQRAEPNSRDSMKENRRPRQRRGTPPESGQSGQSDDASQAETASRERPRGPRNQGKPRGAPGMPRNQGNTRAQGGQGGGGGVPAQGRGQGRGQPKGQRSGQAPQGREPDVQHEVDTAQGPPSTGSQKKRRRRRRGNRPRADGEERVGDPRD